MRALVPASAIFFGSFLLFGIQPMLARTLLPPFGGSAAVWTICLAAYQVLLLVGYGYAHVLASRSARTQRRLHLVLLGLAFLWTCAFAALRLFIRSRIGNSTAPSLEVLFCVTLFVGLPYVLLSANSTLIQSWLARAQAEPPQTPGSPGTAGARRVYQLYAVSNLGSLLGLLAYPFVLEPFVPLQVQWFGFAACLLVYAVLMGLVAGRTLAHDARPPRAGPPGNPAPVTTGLPDALSRAWLWFALPAVSTFLLNAVTVHLTTDVTPVPMMWVLLLTAYLLSYIVGFSAIGEKGLIGWAGLSVLALLAAAYVSGRGGGRGFLPNLVTGAGTLLVCCTCLHGWLYRIRPDVSRLTQYYLGIAAGGALGGVSASLLAPMIFNRVWEYPLGLFVVCAACAWLIRTWNHPELKGLNTFLLLLSVLAAFLVLNNSVRRTQTTVARARNFYGCLRVTRSEVRTSFGDVLPMFDLRHGDTVHGMQVHDRFLRKAPTSYYGPKGGGLAVRCHPKYDTGAPMRVGLVGLGAGTMACHSRTNDFYRFFEINPQVVQFATDTNYFTFIADAPSHVDLALGDARKRLEQERTRGEPLYDALIMDAYSGDAIPFHLATREAFHLYLDRLAPDGILAVHISNWHIDLAPLCKAVASAFNLQVTGIISPQDGLAVSAHWVFLTRTPVSFPADGTREINWAQVRGIALPSDERGSLLPLIRFGHTPPVKELVIDWSKVKLF